MTALEGRRVAATVLFRPAQRVGGQRWNARHRDGTAHRAPGSLRTARAPAGGSGGRKRGYGCAHRGGAGRRPARRYYPKPPPTPIWNKSLRSHFDAMHEKSRANWILWLTASAETQKSTPDGALFSTAKAISDHPAKRVRAAVSEKQRRERSCHGVPAPAPGERQSMAPNHTPAVAPGQRQAPASGLASGPERCIRWQGHGKVNALRAGLIGAVLLSALAVVPRTLPAHVAPTEPAPSGRVEMDPLGEVRDRLERRGALQRNLRAQVDALATEIEALRAQDERERGSAAVRT